MSSSRRSEVTDATREAEADEARVAHGADRPPTPEEEDAVGDETVSDEVRSRYQEMAELGANDPGEGRIP